MERVIAAVVVALVYCSCVASGNMASYNRIDNAPLDDCQILNQVQSNLIRVLGTHYEQGRQIHMLRQVVEGLEKDISVFKETLDRIEDRQSRLENPDAHATTTNEFDAKGMVHKMEKNILNLTKHLSEQDHNYQELEKKYKRLRRMMTKVTTSVGKVENSVVDYMDESLMLEHFLKVQKDINSNMTYRIKYLEKNLQQIGSPQQDQSSGFTQSHGCPKGFVRHFRSCYKFENITANWVDAEKHCQRLHEQSHLISIESKEETDFIVRYRNYNEAEWTNDYIWTGGNDMSKEGEWSWVGTGRVFAYTNWHAGKPDNRNKEQHCIYLRAAGTDHRWDDWHCYAAMLNFICEINLNP